MSLSDRINDTNAAPWVVEEIKKLEQERDALAAPAVRGAGASLEVTGRSDFPGYVICAEINGYGATLGDKLYIDPQPAPELLEALQEMVKMASTGMVDFNPHDEFVMASAIAALAKARGES